MKLTDMIKAISQATDIIINTNSIINTYSCDFIDFNIYLEEFKSKTGDKIENQLIKILFNGGHFVYKLNISDIFERMHLDYFLIKDDFDLIKDAFKERADWLNCFNDIEKAYNYIMLAKILPIKTQTKRVKI